ncbi:polynucleotide adenylyltransferase [Coniosporium apollinis]|uniref:Poly(A) polymerase n=1 Tax=Coniosporium apollinis TaxID=61459 RepID=A0ABQ9NZS3_9PEZI|nr:polynucleotide adenylyltransferase [Coniosporium apollinis]
MAAQHGRQWGVTPPISTALPTDKELAINEAMITELKNQNNFEGQADTERRQQVLKLFQRVTEEFVKHVGTLKGLSPSVIENAGGAVHTFGSYRLGVYGPGSDIDTLVVAPKHVSRDDFFEHFPSLLRKIGSEDAITELTLVRDAYVPIIKIKYLDISIDLIFTRLALSAVPLGLDLKQDSLLRGLDETDLKCINGTRVTDEMLALVPQVKTFRQALRAVKLWAQRRAIYANIMGYPGGVAWAMMVARICQLYPMAAGATLVNKFFHLMWEWPWPRPVMLKEIEDGPLDVRIWNPQIYPGDKRHIMPIITPAYPSMCATHNISYYTKEVIIRELERAKSITNQIMDGKKQWKDLFEKSPFFTQGYKYYLSVIAASKTKEAHDVWSGLVQSKVRRLVAGIEQSDTGVALVQPFNKGFDRIHHCKSKDEEDQVCQGKLDFQVDKTETTEEAKNIKQNAAAEGEGTNSKIPSGESPEVNEDGTTTIYTTTFYVGIELQDGAKSLDISYPVAEFKRQCTDWDQYNPNLNSIRIIHTRNYDLPADVFEPGDVRPTKAKAKKKSKVPSNKRSFTETGMEGTETNGSAKKRQSPNGVTTPAG